MIIPEKVKIGNIIYKVSQTDNNLCMDNKACVGLIRDDDAEIELYTKCDTQKVEETFLHEIIHGIVKDRALDWGDSNEMYTDAIARGLHALIRDNPNMFKDGDI